MKKYTLYLIGFLLVTTLFFMYNSYKSIKENNALKEKLKLTNESYDNNIQYAIKLEDSIVNYQKQIERILLADKFSLHGNTFARSYLDDIDNQTDWEAYVISEIMKTNTKKGNNPLVPFDGMAGEMKITDAKILNNRWIIVRFSDGTYTGEMLLRYYVNPDKSITFKVLDQTLFSN